MDQREYDVQKFQNGVETKLAFLRQQYNNPAEREKLQLKELLCASKCMAERLSAEKVQTMRALLEKSLHEHLLLVLKLLIDQSEKCAEHLEVIAGISCELSKYTGPRMKLIDVALQLCAFCLQNVPGDVKFGCFRKLGNAKFGNCAEFLINAQCVSSQFQMLQILCSFVEDATEPLEQLWPLFETKLNRHTFNALKSVKWCTGVGVPLARQLYMLEHINQMRTATHKDRWIFSESIESIKFDDRVAIACEENDGKFYMNKLAKSIDLLVTYASAPLVIHINAKKLKNVQIIVDELHWVREMRLEFNAPPSICNRHSKQIKPAKMDVKGEYMDVVFDTGFNRSQLLLLLTEMFGITPVIIKRSNCEISDAEYDSDIEIVHHHKFEALSDDETRMEISSPIKPLSPIDQSTPKPQEFIRKDPAVVLKSKSPLPSPVATEKVIDRQRDVFAKPKLPPPLQNGWITKQSPASPAIPSGSFYGKKTTNTKAPKKVPPPSPPIVPQNEPPTTPKPNAPRRSRRASAQTALGNIRRTLELSQFDFDENDDGEVELKRKRPPATKAPPKKPKRMRKPAEPPKWPVLNIEVNKAKNGKKEPRKLYTIDHDLNDDDDKTAPKTPKMVKHVKSRDSIAADLTPASFRSSMYADPQRAQHRVLENVMKINARAHKRDETMNNLNVSYSYRRASHKNKLQEPSQVIFSQADSTSRNLEQKKRKICYAEFNQVAADNDDDGIDVDMPLDINCNHEKDAHLQKKCDIKKELNEIKDSVNRAIDLLSE